MKKYNKEEFIPRLDKWEKMGVAMLTEVDADILNDAHKGVRYVLDGEKDSKDIKVLDLSYDKADVIEALEIVEIKLAKNTGVKKTQEAIDSLEEDELEAVVEVLKK